MKLNICYSYNLLFILFFYSSDVNAQLQNADEIYIAPQVQATPMMANFKNYILENLYKHDTSFYSLNGKVVAQFVVEKDGNIGETKMLKSYNAEVDSIIIRIIQQSPNWTPGSDQGEKVRTRQIIPIELVDKHNLLNDSSIFQSPDLPAKFNGDYEKYVNDSLIYPEVALTARIEAKIEVTFIVEKNGLISKITNIEKKGWGFDEEVIRLINNMPNWIPATHSGVPVRSYQIQILHFEIGHKKEEQD